MVNRYLLVAVYSMHTYAGLAAVYALAVAGLAAVLALYYAAICGAFVALTPVNSAWKAIILRHSGCWKCASIWLTGFGWARRLCACGRFAGGYAPWIGAYGLCALSAWLAMTIPQAFARAMAAGGRAAGPDVAVCGADGWRWLFQRCRAPVGHPAAGQYSARRKFQPGTGVVESLRWYGAQLQRAQANW